ncbi:MAG: histidine kinase [Bacteroidota bacterium]
MALKRYSKKEPLVFVWVMVPYTIFINMLVLGTCIFDSVSLFARSFLSSAIYLFFVYAIFGIVALLIQKRFPSAGDMFRRIAIMLPVFYVMNAIMVPGIFYIYGQWLLVSCTPKPGMTGLTILYGCVVSTILTFINEAIANWEAWKRSVTETEKLKNAYQRSRVLGLRGQLNPHFLFNCFNTLSGLIQENEDKAEKFLNEMTKVHRYLLRSDDDLLIPLEQEIKFAESYLYLAKERFGDAIVSSVDVDQHLLKKNIPPLSMQVILENIIYTNALSKTDPLHIRISSANEHEVMVTNSIHGKTVVQNLNIDEGLDNLLNKYRMLNADNVVIHEDGRNRTLHLPLFDEKEGSI